MKAQYGFLTFIISPNVIRHVRSLNRDLKSVSGLRSWVDLDTPASAFYITTSRDHVWELTMSDEFNVPGRDLRPGKDPLWTAVELPDGVNAALEYYSFNMTSIISDKDGRGVLQIETRSEDNITFQVYNAYADPPAFKNYSMYYRSGMVQSWNKFCFQGGLLEVSAKLPGAVRPDTGNPDLENDVNDRVKHLEYYPTWPGLWLMGNLGRALFTRSTDRMWPWSYNECRAELAQSQRINACNKDPGYGMNANQGRGAPEIDLLEGGGVAISTSIQVAPGMPSKFRIIKPDKSIDPNGYCAYSRQCDTIGANIPGVPTAAYTARGYDSWYQNLKYASNTNCNPVASLKQDPAAVIQSRKTEITSNACMGINTCSASYDGNALLARMENSKKYWGINDDGTCMPVINGYHGTYLCDPFNKDPLCHDPPKLGDLGRDDFVTYNYQMDAISANSEVPLKAYTDYVKYQLEWVVSDTGFVRWMVDGASIFEISSQSLTNPPQDREGSNYRKLMIEEPMYIIFNVALSTSWGSRPPNPGSPCKGDGKDATTNRICDAFPMYMKIDYIRLYQDTSENSTMKIGCDPASHPTERWIEGHLSEYQDSVNPMIQVVGGGHCKSDEDCSVATMSSMPIKTGKCSNKRCQCFYPSSWIGPRCTTSADNKSRSGPTFVSSLICGSISAAIMAVALYKLLASDLPLLHKNNFAKVAAYNEHDMVDVSQISGSLDPSYKVV